MTAHDGFTLRDLVSYEAKHNEANGEDNRDGTDDNRSSNCGAEGDTDDPAVNACRAAQQRNLLATVLLSQGVPMLCAGDELGRTQRGNNNAYCQDSELSWLHWDEVDVALLGFTRELVALRLAHPVLHRRRWFIGQPIHGTADIEWAAPDGAPMPDADWDEGIVRSVAVYLNGQCITAPDERGRRVLDDSFVLVFHADSEPITWQLPAAWGSAWEVALASHDEPSGQCSGTLEVPGRSVIALRSLDGP